MYELPVWATEVWRCVCGVFVPPAFVGCCPCGQLHPDHPLRYDDD